MNIENEAIFAAFGVLSTVICFLFGIYKNNMESFKKETRTTIDKLVIEINELRNERAKMMRIIGRLETENRFLRAEINGITHQHDNEHQHKFEEDDDDTPMSFL